MKEVRVNKNDLLKIVKENREKHIKEYKEAVEGYKEAALDQIEKGMARLRAQVEGLKKGQMIALAHITFDLQVPCNYQDDYDQIIQMLEMSVDESIVLSKQEHLQYVMDKWQWKGSFENTTMFYNNKLWKE
jgi:hypothetical protein